jgi:hypothetical protein
MNLNSNDLMNLSMALDDLKRLATEHTVDVTSIWMNDVQFSIEAVVTDGDDWEYVFEGEK